MSKDRSANEFQIKQPCGESWEEMTGSDTVRFCSHCAKSVNNISNMRRKDALRMVRASNGRICIRYIEDPATAQPIFLTRLRKIAANSAVPAGVLATTLALTGTSSAQVESVPQTEIRAEQVATGERPATEPSAAISGYVLDPKGAAVPFALVSITNEALYDYRIANADAEGHYEFTSLPAGTYKLRAEAPGFEPIELGSLALGEGSRSRRDPQLGLQQAAEIVEVSPGPPGFAFSATIGVTMSTTFRQSNPLVTAVMNEDLEEVKARVMMGDQVNARDKGREGMTPLHAAVEAGNIEIVQYLLDRGAKVNARDRLKRTPLMMLDEDATPELVQLLLRYGAKPLLVDKEGNTSLMMAARSAEAEIVRILVVAGVPVNARNIRGETALYLAADEGETEVVKVLLESGADPNIATLSGKTALDAAEGDGETVSLLSSYGATARRLP